MRSLGVWDAGYESPLDGFRNDQAMLAALAGGTERALCRLWRRPEVGLSAGRFHRIPPGAVAIARRLTGGRMVPVGPGVLGSTLVAPRPAWLDPGAAELRPEQILNRALRPILGVLRSLGVDAFYPGRDLVTVDRKPLLCAGFTVTADGCVVVEHCLSLDETFANLPRLLATHDPDAVAAVDTRQFEASIALCDVAKPPSREQWGPLLASASIEASGCEAAFWEQPPPELRAVAHADEAAFAAHADERGPRTKTAASASAVSMLGVVEAAADVTDGYVRSLTLAGDLIAPFHTIERIADLCEGRRFVGAEIRRSVVEALAAPGAFVLGIADIAELIVAAT